jgi:hypothetical protein
LSRYRCQKENVFQSCHRSCARQRHCERRTSGSKGQTSRRTSLCIRSDLFWAIYLQRPKHSKLIIDLKHLISLMEGPCPASHLRSASIHIRIPVWNAAHIPNRASQSLLPLYILRTVHPCILSALSALFIPLLLSASVADSFRSLRQPTVQQVPNKLSQ